MGLKEYNRKRRFEHTPEPEGKTARSGQHRFVVHEHHASRLHFDFRLEMDGVLKSWAVPKGPSMDPSHKRLAVLVEDHPVTYIDFEGHIAEGNYGAGDVVIWDEGRYAPSDGENPAERLDQGKLTFSVDGRKLKGTFSLVRTSRGEDQWLLIKGKDEFAEPGWELETMLPAEPAGTNKTPTSASKPDRSRASSSSRRTTTRAKKVPAETGDVHPASVLEDKNLSGDLAVAVDGGTVRLTSLGKTYWPDAGYTKGDLIRYYHQVAPYILPYLKDRPLILRRFPNGIEGSSFFQHEAGEVPEFVDTAAIKSEEGRIIDYVLCNNEATLLYLANLGAIDRHPWHTRVDDLDHPDWIVFDLDPGPKAAFDRVCMLAMTVRDVLHRIGLESHAKTSGSRGVHVYVPVQNHHPYEVVAELAERVADAVVRQDPRLATVERTLTHRKENQVYVDHLQNARGKSVVSPHSARPKPGATVSTPVTWKELEKGVDPAAFTIRTVPGRLSKTGDVFRPVLDDPQPLEHALEAARALD